MILNQLGADSSRGEKRENTWLTKDIDDEYALPSIELDKQRQCKPRR